MCIFQPFCHCIIHDSHIPRPSPLPVSDHLLYAKQSKMEVEKDWDKSTLLSIHFFPVLNWTVGSNLLAYFLSFGKHGLQKTPDQKFIFQFQRRLKMLCIHTVHIYNEMVLLVPRWNDSYTVRIPSSTGHRMLCADVSILSEW